MSVTVDQAKFKYSSDVNGGMELITPTDDTEITVNGKYPRRIYVGTAGNINFYDHSGEAKLCPNVPVGIHAFPYVGVANTNTTASDLVALG